MKHIEANWVGSWYSYRYDVKLDTTHNGQTLILDPTSLIRTPIQIHEQPEVGRIEGVPHHLVKASWNDSDLEGNAKHIGDYFYIILDDDIPQANNKKNNGKKRITLTVHNKQIIDEASNTIYLKAITNTFTHGSIKESTPIGIRVVLEKVDSDIENTHSESRKISFEEAPAVVKDCLQGNYNFISIEGIDSPPQQEIHSFPVRESNKKFLLSMVFGFISFLGLGWVLIKNQDSANKEVSSKREIATLNAELTEKNQILNNLGFNSKTVISHCSLRIMDLF